MSQHAAAAAAEQIIVLRYGELFLKGRNRSHFEDVLERNVRRTLAELQLDNARLQRGQGRMFITELQDAHTTERLAAKLALLFGFSSLSIASAVEQDIDQITATAVELAVSHAGAARTFRVDTQRADKGFPLTSVDINREVGAAIAQRTSLPVDLSNADLVVGVEIGPLRSFVFVGRRAGAGGLPVGSEGKVLLLLSGGIDSPVAGHLMQKRGCALEAVYFHSPPYTSEHARDKVEQLAGRLVRNQPTLPLHVVPFTELQCDVRDHAPPEMAVVLYRRAMIRIACALAEKRGIPALATGESLGQVASQTLQNLAAIEAVATMPVLRPLISFDKQETIAVAKAIDTYELSILPHDDCCSLFVPKHPVTRSTLKRAEKAERDLAAELLRKTIDAVETVDIT